VREQTIHDLIKLVELHQKQAELLTRPDQYLQKEANLRWAENYLEMLREKAEEEKE
jgi:hypothetical protein